MVVAIIVQVAISCGVVIVYSLVGKYFVSCLGLRRYPKPLDSEEVVGEEDEEEQEDVVQSEALKPSPDAIHLLRLSNAFCPPGIQPPIFGYDVNLSGHKSSLYSDELGEDDNFSDVLEESSFCVRDSFEHGHTHRISIKAPTFIHQPSTAEISTGDHKSTSSERRSSTTFAPETHHENDKVEYRLFSSFAKGPGPNGGGGSRKKLPGYQRKNSCESEANGAWGQLTSKRKKLFTVRPSISALRRFNQSKQVHQVEQPKLFTGPARIDYINTVRTRFKMISSKRLSIKPASKIIPHNHPEMRSSEINGGRLSSVFFGSV